MKNYTTTLIHHANMVGLIWMSMMNGVKNIARSIIRVIGNVGKSVLKGDYMQRWEAFNKMLDRNDSFDKQVEQIYAIKILDHDGKKNFDKSGLRKSIETWLKEEEI